jgi:hypothetical protein
MAEHGSRSRYREGCRCAKCRAANAEYNRNYYIEGKKPSPGAVLPDTGPGPVEVAARGQLEGLSRAQSEPAIAAAVLALARLLDSARTPSAHPAAARQMAVLLDGLAKGSDRRKSGLAAVREMTRSTG